MTCRFEFDDQAASPSRFLSSLLWLSVAGVLLSTRVVSARGDLGVDERATIELFEKSRDSVVYITTKSQVMDFWTRTSSLCPEASAQGSSGSGMITPQSR